MNGSLIRYTGDGVARAWLIPFPYGGPQDFRVEVAQNGETVELSYAAGDFRVIDRCVVYELAAGATLAITLTSPLYRMQGLNERRVLAAELAGQNEERAAFHAQAAAQIAEDAAASAKGAVEEAREEASAIAGKTISHVTDKANALILEAASARDAALAKIAALAREAIERVHNPGLAALQSMASLFRQTQGFYIINPRLAGETGAQGLWPVKDVSRIAWDGFYVLLPECPGHVATDTGWSLPYEPGSPANPGGPANPGPSESGDASGQWWLPCDHTHNP